MLSSSHKALLLGIITVAFNGILFAVDISSGENRSGITIHLPEESVNIVQSVPDAPIMPPSDEAPPENAPSAAPSQPSQMPPPPVMPPSSSGEAMGAPISSPSGVSMATGDVNPGWRPVPNAAQFPRNPFSGVATMETPVAFKQEFDALAKNIIGYVEVGKNSVLIVQNRVVREGDTIKLVKEAEKGSTTFSDPQNPAEAMNTPVAIFSGVDKKKEAAKFLLGDMEVNVPIPSTRKKIENANGLVNRIEGIATATFIGEKGYFVVASDLVPEMDPQKKVYMKTQFGVATVSIIKRDADSNLALGRVDALNLMGLYNGIKVGQSKEDANKSSIDVLVFDISKEEGLSRPKSVKVSSSQANPKWIAGCPAFAGQTFLGVMVMKQDKFEIVGQDEIQSLFPEAFTITQDDKQKAEGVAPSQLKTEENGFFNPEKLVGLIYMETINE